MRLSEVWSSTKRYIESHAIPIIASCMLLALVSVADNGFARWLNYTERKELRAESVNSVELREVRKMGLTLIDRIGQLNEKLDRLESRNAN